jgi:hypothetical protein
MFHKFKKNKQYMKRTMKLNQKKDGGFLRLSTKTINLILEFITSRQDQENKSTLVGPYYPNANFINNE